MVNVISIKNMKSLKLIKLTSQEMNKINGGESGNGTPTCSCTCTCHGEDTTYSQNLGMTSSATSTSVISSAPIK